MRRLKLLGRVGLALCHLVPLAIVAYGIAIQVPEIAAPVTVVTSLFAVGIVSFHVNSHRHSLARHHSRVRRKLRKQERGNLEQADAHETEQNRQYSLMTMSSGIALVCVLVGATILYFWILPHIQQ